jgi:hypothetical protein
MRKQMAAYTLEWVDGGLRILKNESVLYKNPTPMFAYIKNKAALTDFVLAPYDYVQEEADKVVAGGRLETKSGSVFCFKDRYLPDENAFRLERRVFVEQVGEDLGFQSKFSLVLSDEDNLSQFDYFAPGHWYGQNTYTHEQIMGHDHSSTYFWKKETSLALPLFSARSLTTGESVMFSRSHADIKEADYSFVRSENSVDEKCNVASIGLSRSEHKSLNYLYYGYAVETEQEQVSQGLSLDYVFPYSEGESYNNHVYNVDYFFRNKKMTRACHPVRLGFSQAYAVDVHLGQEKDFYAMMKHSWRTVYAKLRDPLFAVDFERYYHDIMYLLKDMTGQYGKAWGLPFACQLPGLDISSVSFQMGFVGQQIGIAYQMLYYAYAYDDKVMREKALGIINFWLDNSVSETGVAHVCFQAGSQQFEPYPIWIRMLADGMENMLCVYRLLLDRGEEKPACLDYCRRVADWLLKIQNADGSFYRAYNEQGEGVMESCATTPMLLRFFAELYRETEEEKYRIAAIKAGEWALAHSVEKMEYVGATCDNAAILDKESGIYAMRGFLSLYEMDGDVRWKKALVASADFTETWMYAWSYPIRTLWPNHPFNHNHFSGHSLITVGGDGADGYMSYCSYDYYRVYEITGDRHYLDVAEFIHHNTKQSSDTSGACGYKYRALNHESANFSSQTLGGNYHWLPWCSYVEVDALLRLHKRAGVFDFVSLEEIANKKANQNLK